MPDIALPPFPDRASSPHPEAAEIVEAVTLARAEPGRPYHITSLGPSRLARLELLSAGLAPDAIVSLLRGDGCRPRIVACGEIRAAIGIDLASGIQLKPCGCGCGCDRRGKDV